MRTAYSRRHAVIGEYADFRHLMAHWERRRVPEGRVRKLPIENYARVLRQTLGWPMFRACKLSPVPALHYFVAFA